MLLTEYTLFKCGQARTPVMHIRIVCAQSTLTHVRAHSIHMQTEQYDGYPLYEHMQTQTRTLPLEHSCGNLSLSCASKSDISGWI